MLEKLNFLRQKLGKWIWVIIVVILIAAWNIISASTKTLKVESAKVTRGNLVQAVSTSGNVTADNYSVLSFQTGGMVKAVGVTSGQSVKKGQFIAQLDTTSLNAAYQSAQNTYRATQAAVDLEHDNDKNYGSAETFAQKSTRTAAEVTNDNAYNAVLSARDALRNATIFAPFTGVMDTVSPSSPGVNVMIGAANYTIVDPNSIYFSAEVVETDLPNVEVGQNVKIKLDAYPDKEFSGTVESTGMVAFVSSTGGNAYRVRISLPGNQDQKIKVGMGGDAEIVYKTISDTLKVPLFAVTVSGDKNYVWVVDGGRAKKVEVQTGGSSIDETEIKSGLSEGQTVISQPPVDLKEGQKVSI